MMEHMEGEPDFDWDEDDNARTVEGADPMTTNTRPTWPDLKARELAEHLEVFAVYAAFLAAVRRGERPDRDYPSILVEIPEDLPAFASEEEEVEYWGTHEMGDAFYEDAEFLPEITDALARIRARRAKG
jgi:hypothetical protein